MKTLIIVRHAKSSWDDLDLADFDRPLNERGKRDAPRMAKRLKEKDLPIDLMLSSPAKRALATCKRMAKVLDYPLHQIQTDQELYHADDDEILSIVRRLNKGNHTVMIFGHNPGLTTFANRLTKSAIMNIPTCGILACTFNVETWSDIRWSEGKTLFYDFPKNKED